MQGCGGNVFFKVHFSEAFLSKVYFCEMYPTCVSSKLCEFISLYVDIAGSGDPLYVAELYKCWFYGQKSSIRLILFAKVVYYMREGFKIPTIRIPTIIIPTRRDFNWVCRDFNWVRRDFNWVSRDFNWVGRDFNWVRRDFNWVRLWTL